MLKRKIYNKLLSWKTTKNQECLLVKGARQIGKTFIIDKFGKDCYASYIYLNFYQNPEYKEIFEGSLAAEEIYKKISLYAKDIRFVKHNTLIFLDEIQECPGARTALKFLAIDNQYDVIASGSLLGLHYKEMASIPVGYERTIEMFSLDFEEFMWASGKSEKAISVMEEYFQRKEKIADNIHEQFMVLTREYLVVGGMPEVVNTFLKSNNYQDVYATQKKSWKAITRILSIMHPCRFVKRLVIAIILFRDNLRRNIPNFSIRLLLRKEMQDAMIIA